jgi:hypothetical protein
MSARKRVVTANLNRISVNSNSPLARSSHRTERHGPQNGNASAVDRCPYPFENGRPTPALANHVTPIENPNATGQPGTAVRSQQPTAVEGTTGSGYSRASEKTNP